MSCSLSVGAERGGCPVGLSGCLTPLRCCNSGIIVVEPAGMVLWIWMILCGGLARPSDQDQEQSWWVVSPLVLIKLRALGSWCLSYGSGLTCRAGTPDCDHWWVVLWMLFSESDPRQAYTANFGGTSGSPMIVAAAVIANAVSQHHEGPGLAVSRAAQQSETHSLRMTPSYHRPQPNIRRLLWTWGIDCPSAIGPFYRYDTTKCGRRCMAGCQPGFQNDGAR